MKSFQSEIILSIGHDKRRKYKLFFQALKIPFCCDEIALGEKKITFIEHLEVPNIRTESSFIILFDPVDVPKNPRKLLISKGTPIRLAAVRKNSVLRKNGFRAELVTLKRILQEKGFVGIGQNLRFIIIYFRLVSTLRGKFLWELQQAGCFFPFP